MISSKTKIGLLVAAHIVAGLALAWANYGSTVRHDPAQFGLFALVFAEAGLLGIWGALGTTPRRLSKAIIATEYLCGVLIAATWMSDLPFLLSFRVASQALLLVFSPNLVILLVLSGLRHSRRRLRLAQLTNESLTAKGIRFTIRQLLVITAAAAIVFAMSRGVRTITATQRGDILTVAIFTPFLVMVDLAMLWAALGIGRPTPRLAVVVPTAFAVGALLAYCLGRADWSLGIFWSMVLGLQGIIAACSLLVIRSCGCRLVRGDRNDIEPAAF